MATSAALRSALVGRLEKAGQVRSERVQRAFLRVKRELFIPEVVKTEGLAAIYEDKVFITKKDAAGLAISSSSQPGIMAPMLERLDVQLGHRVLEIGTGSGYNAALLAVLVGKRGEVVTVDIDPELVTKARTALKNGGFAATVQVADGRTLRGVEGPFDRIIVTASSDELPRAWHRRLVRDGLLVVPFRLREDQFTPQAVITFRRIGMTLESIDIIGGGFMGLRPSADSGSPVTQTEGIVAYEYRKGKPVAVCTVMGAALAKLSVGRRADLLTSLLRGPRRTLPISGRTDWMALQILLIYGFRRPQVVDFGRLGHTGLGLFDARSASLSAVVGKPKWAGLTAVLERARLESYGDKTAERALLDVLNEWNVRGRPAVGDIVFRALYGSSSLSKSWRRCERRGVPIEIDWRSASD